MSSSKISSEVARRLGAGNDMELGSISEENTNLDSHSSANISPEIASNESRNVFRARMLVMMILAGVAAGISAGVFVVTSQAQERAFDAQWQGNSLQIVNSFEEIIKEKFGAISTLGVSFTSYARSQNRTWPFVTMNDFQERAAIARQVSNAIHTQVMPIINAETRAKWEEYSVENVGWLADGIEYQQSIGMQEALGQYLDPAKPFTEDPSLDFSSGIASKIWSFDPKTFLPFASTSPPNYYPMWQESPIPYRNLINWNAVELPTSGPFIEVCAATGDIVIGGCDVYPPGNVSSPDPSTSWFAFLLSFAAGHLVEYTGDPMTPIYLPVFDSYDRDRRQVAVIYALISWKSYFYNVLPSNVEPIVIVLSNSCQGPFTYIVDGPDVQFVGAGDLHSEGLEPYAQHVELKDLLSESINGFSLNQDVCQYNLTVYPTPQMYNQYNTSNTIKEQRSSLADYPLYATLSVCLIFFFTGFMFLVYDHMVEMRQDIVMRQASKTTAIVSSLFPESVTKRLLADKSTNHERKFLSPNKRLQTFLTSEGEDQQIMQAKPIADLFPYTTVIFGDIAGFTSWSSSRDPLHVFLLLEKIYSAFDKLAAQHKLFKVETIGKAFMAA